MAVFKRSISEGAGLTAGLFTPVMPVRKVVAKSVRGKLVGAMLAPSTTPSKAGRVGLVT